VPRAPRGRGSVYRDGDRWVAEKRIEGKRVRRVRKTRESAYLALDELNDARKRGLTLSASPTVAEWLDNWLVTLEVRPTTLRGYDTYVREYLVPHLGSVKLDRLSPLHVDRMLAALKTRLAPRSVAHARAILRNALRKAEQYGYVTRNVAEIVDAVKVGQPERRMLTPTQVRQYRESWRGDRLEALFVIAMTLGLRRSELAGLRWSDLEPVNGHINSPNGQTIHVRQTLHRVNRETVASVPKTDRSRRDVPMTQEIAALLVTHRARQREEYLATGARPTEDLVFTTPSGRPISMNKVWIAHRDRLRELELPHISLHDLRHVSASHLAAAGFTLKEVQALLGHASIATTANVYTHSDDGLLAEKMRAVAISPPGW
jgi:integrase